MSLVITPYITDILALIRAHPVTQINAPTGSGKSIGIPKALSEAGYSVFISVPTRVSAISLAGYLQTLIPAISVGHAAEGIVKYGPRTQVVYATSGHMRRKLLGYFSAGTTKSRQGLTFADILILDETHCSSLDNSILISLWMYARKHQLAVPKLVLLSATPSKLPIQPEPVIFSVPVPTPFPVDVIYIPAEMDVYTHACEIAADKYHDPSIEGDFLIFAPGAREVEDCVTKIQEDIPTAVVLPAYSTLPAEELEKIYNKAPEGERKIIVATNIAESSITIDGLVLVIDTMQYKEAMASASGATRLETSVITKSSAQQRLGRVGRTRPGTCYRLISEEDYMLLKDHQSPEIERVPVHNIVMEFLKVAIDPIENIAGIIPERVAESIKLLTRLGMIENGTVTECGDFAPTVPLGVRNAAFLWHWIKQGQSIYPGIVIAGLIDAFSGGYFYIPRRRKNMSPPEYKSFCIDYIREKFAKWIGESPLHTYLNMWHDFTESLGRVHFRLIDNPSSVNFKKWSFDHSLNQRQLWDVIFIISQTYRVVRSSMRHKDINVAVTNTEDIMKIAVPLLQDIYADNAMIPSMFSDSMLHPETGIKHIFNSCRVISELERRCKDRIVPLATHEITDKYSQILGYIDLCIYYPLPQPVVDEIETITPALAECNLDDSSSDEESVETPASLVLPMRSVSTTLPEEDFPALPMLSVSTNAIPSVVPQPSKNPFSEEEFPSLGSAAPQKRRDRRHFY